MLFAYGSGSSRHSPRNQLLAEALARAGLGTLLFDLLTRTGAAAALAAAARLGEQVGAVVSGGGRPDLAAPMLALVTAPTLLIAGALDTQGLALNEQALAPLRCEKELLIVPGASQLFEEPGTFDQVAVLATEWFTRHLD